MDWVSITNLALIIPASRVFWLHGASHHLTITAWCTTILSTLYHCHHEHHRVLHWLEPLSVRIFTLLFFIEYYDIILTDSTAQLLSAFTILCYYLGTGRKCSERRSTMYTIWHSAFHLMISILGSYIMFK